VKKQILLVLAATALMAGSVGQAQTLKGSSASMKKQNQIAIAYGYSFIQTSNAVFNYVNKGELFKVEPTSHMELHDVSYPYARAGVKLFLERLSTQYHAACGEKLTVTSLARPIDKQPANAASNSVHPTGMAADLRIPPRGRCRSWLEQTLLALEGDDVLDVTRERNPPHYHVAVFTEAYQSYLASRAQTPHEYIVRPGDSLWLIAARTSTTVNQLRAANGLANDLINVGQRLQIPGEKGEVASLSAAPTMTEVSTPLQEVTHTVRRGDTLWQLANRYGSSVSQIQRDNGLKGNRLQIGQILLISSVGSHI